VGFGSTAEDGRGTPVDDPTTTIDVSLEDEDAAADTDNDDNMNAFDEESAATDNISDEPRHDDRVSLRIDDSDVIEPPSKPGESFGRESLSPAVFKMLGCKHIGVTSLTFRVM